MKTKIFLYVRLTSEFAINMAIQGELVGRLKLILNEVT